MWFNRENSVGACPPGNPLPQLKHLVFLLSLLFTYLLASGMAITVAGQTCETQSTSLSELPYSISCTDSSASDTCYLTYTLQLGDPTEPVSNLHDLQIELKPEDAIPTSATLALDFDGSWLTAGQSYSSDFTASPDGTTLTFDFEIDECGGVTGHGLAARLQLSAPCADLDSLDLCDFDADGIAIMVDMPTKWTGPRPAGAAASHTAIAEIRHPNGKVLYRCGAPQEGSAAKGRQAWQNLPPGCYFVHLHGLIGQGAWRKWLRAD